jgi:hypothetical protein
MKFSLSLTMGLAAQATAENSTYYNPVLPGWHSDPSCIHVSGTCTSNSRSFFPFMGVNACSRNTCSAPELLPRLPMPHFRKETADIVGQSTA